MANGHRWPDVYDYPRSLILRFAREAAERKAHDQVTLAWTFRAASFTEKDFRSFLNTLNPNP